VKCGRVLPFTREFPPPVSVPVRHDHHRGVSSEDPRHCTFPSQKSNTYQVEVGRTLQLPTSIQSAGFPGSMAAQLRTIASEITFGKCVYD
jgi:hypothetical protein